MNLDLNNKRAIVAGSTAGIGLAIAKELSFLGAHCTLLSRNEEKLKEVLKTLDNNGNQNHNYLIADFNDPEKVVDTINDFLFNNKVHILINNTGGPPGGPIVNASIQEFQNALTQHLFCNHLITQAVLPSMKEEGYGRIVNIISTSIKIPLKGLGVSNTTRGAVAAWSKTIANEVASFGITVNNILPGATSTGRLSSIIENKAGKLGLEVEDVSEEMVAEIPMGRFGKPEEIANVAAFLCTPAASYVTGVSIQVDGGRTGSLT